MIDDFFRDIDDRWTPTASGKIRLRLIGSTALMLQSDYDRGTKDSDVLQTAQITKAVDEQLRALAGMGTDLHRRHRLYVDIVAAALPFLPQQPKCHPQASLSASLANFDIEVLDKEAVDAFEMDSRADELPHYVRNSNSVERNIFNVSETLIELPSWVSD